MKYSQICKQAKEMTDKKVKSISKWMLVHDACLVLLRHKPSFHGVRSQQKEKSLRSQEPKAGACSFANVILGKNLISNQISTTLRFPSGKS